MLIRASGGAVGRNSSLARSKYCTCKPSAPRISSVSGMPKVATPPWASKKRLSCMATLWPVSGK